jgi:hypothetical protein
MANEFPGGENRAHVEKHGLKNRMTPMSADGGAAVARPPNDITAPAICGSTPMRDPRTSAAKIRDHVARKG